MKEWKKILFIAVMLVLALVPQVYCYMEVENYATYIVAGYLFRENTDAVLEQIERNGYVIRMDAETIIENGMFVTKMLGIIYIFLVCLLAALCLILYVCKKKKFMNIVKWTNIAIIFITAIQFLYALVSNMNGLGESGIKWEYAYTIPLIELIFALLFFIRTQSQAWMKLQEHPRCKMALYILYLCITVIGSRMSYGVKIAAAEDQIQYFWHYNIFGRDSIANMEVLNIRFYVILMLAAGAAGMALLCLKKLTDAILPYMEMLLEWMVLGVMFYTIVFCMYSENMCSPRQMFYPDIIAAGWIGMTAFVQVIIRKNAPFEKRV